MILILLVGLLSEGKMQRVCLKPSAQRKVGVEPASYLWLVAAVCVLRLIPINIYIQEISN